MATSEQTSLEVPLDSAVVEAPQQGLLPPPIRREDGKLLPGHHGITKKRVRAGLMEEINAAPEKWQATLRLWLDDCTHPDPAVRAEARKSLADRIEGKPTQILEDEHGRQYVAPVLTFVPYEAP